MCIYATMASPPVCTVAARHWGDPGASIDNTLLCKAFYRRVGQTKVKILEYGRIPNTVIFERAHGFKL